MNCNQIINSCNCVNQDDFSQILGILGTLLGTLLGWLLKYLQDNLGGTKIVMESFVDCKDEFENYAFNLKLFICNRSINPKYIRDLKIVFYDKKNKILERTPKYSDNEISFQNINSKDKIDIVNLNYNQPVNIVLCDYISNEDFDRLKNVSAIILTYKNKNNRIKKVKINKNFSFSEVEKYKKGNKIPS